MKRRKVKWGLVFFGIVLILGSLALLGTQHSSVETTVGISEDYYYYGEEGPQSEFSYRASEILKAEGIYVPLYLQNDERWKSEEIDYNFGTTMEDAGSGFMSMMMLQAATQEIHYDYFEFYDWVYGDYFTDNHSLKWKFFIEATQNENTPLQSLGKNPEKAQPVLAMGSPVIVSFKENTWYPEEHFAVLAQDSAGFIRVLDPLDSPETEHYLKTFTLEELAGQIQNYWAAVE